jgi:hypothetical protein
VKESYKNFLSTSIFGLTFRCIKNKYVKNRVSSDEKPNETNIPIEPNDVKKSKSSILIPNIQH